MVLSDRSLSKTNASNITSKRVVKSLRRLGISSRLIDSEQEKTTLLRDLKSAGIVFLGLHSG